MAMVIPKEALSDITGAMESLQIEETKNSVIETSAKDSLFAQIVDILYSYNYDQRINGFELSSESSLNIVRLSSTLAAFVDYHELPTIDQKLLAVVVGSYRRSLVFTLFRSYKLASKIFEDMVLTKESVIGTLEKVKSMFDEGKYRLYNKCFIDDLCKWVRLEVSNGELMLL